VLCHVGRPPFQRERSRSFVRDSVFGLANHHSLPAAVVSLLGEQVHLRRYYHAEWISEEVNYREIRATSSDREWKKDKEVRRVERSTQIGFSVGRGLFS
jgi:hypothetical protein